MTDRTAPGHAAVRVVRASDPAAEAMRLAAELDADVAVDAGVAERAVRARVEAGRAAIGGAAADDVVVIARAEQIRAAAAEPPPIGDDEVEELRRLAADLGRATRIRQRTEIRVQEVLQAKVAASTGVAIHPAAVTSASEAVVAAERALAAAESEIADLDDPDDPDDSVAEPEPAATIDDDPVLRLPHDDFDEALLERRHGSRRAALAVVVVAAVAAVAVALGASVLVLPVAAVVAILAAVLLVGRGERAARELDTPAPTASPVVVPAPAAEPAPTLDRAPREAAVESARERLRVARNRWHQLVGPDADPHQPEAVVRAHDPQLAYDDRVAESSPTMRTVAAFHRKAQARWRVVWAAMGRDEPPAPDALEATLDELLAGHRAAVAELATLEAAEARDEARHGARRPLILVEPQTWVTPGRLDQLLASVPPEGEVILVEKG